jgi:hypothetical protein
MAVEYLRRRDDFGEYKIARVHSPLGQYIDISPFSGLSTMEISHQNKGRSHGFGAKFVMGPKNSRVLQIGSIGETSKFIQELKQELSPSSRFWKQD